VGLNWGRSYFTRLRREWRWLRCDRHRLNNFDTRHRLRWRRLDDGFAERSYGDGLGEGRSFGSGLFDNGSSSVFFNHGSEKFTLLGNDCLGDFNGRFRLDEGRVFDCSFSGFSLEGPGGRCSAFIVNRCGSSRGSRVSWREYLWRYRGLDGFNRRCC